MRPEREPLVRQGILALAEIHRRGDELAAATEKFLRQMDELENPRPAGSWFALEDALEAYRKASHA